MFNRDVNQGWRDVLLALCVLFPVCVFIMVSVGFFFGIAVLGSYMFIALFVSMIVTNFLYHLHIKVLLLSSAVFLALLIFFTCLSSLIIDSAWDSRVYHLPAIIALKQGWNPFLAQDVCLWTEQFCLPTYELSNSYPKATWIVAATFYHLTENFETGKAMGFIALISAFLACLAVLSNVPALSPRQSTFIALGLTLNPVALVQLSSFYVDGIHASLLLALLALLLNFVLFKQRASLLLAGALLVFVINIKFTGLVYSVVICLGMLILCAVLNSRQVTSNKRASVGYLFGVLVLSGSVGIGMGFSPYITNTLKHKNPFYPAASLWGGGNVIERQAHPDFINKNRFSKLTLSVFSRSYNDAGPQLFNPLTSWEVASGVDSRFSGFGTPFSILIILSVVVAFWVRNKVVVAIIAIVVVSIFITSAGWWARLAPQLWWLPILSIIGVFINSKAPKSIIKLASGMLGLVIILCLATSIKEIKNTSKDARQHEEIRRGAGKNVQLAEMATHTLDVAFAFTLAQRLRDKGVQVTMQPMERCFDPTVWAKTYLCQSTN